MHHVSFFAETNARKPYRPVGIYVEDRTQHLYVIGKTGTGKSTLLENLIRADIEAGRGCILIDPHGDLAERVHAAVPHPEHSRLVYLDIARETGRYGYNPLKRVQTEYIPLAASGLLTTFRHHFGEKSWGHRMEHIFRNVLYALLEYGEADLSDVLRMLSDSDFRERVVRSVKNPQVRYFFEEEWKSFAGSSLKEAIAPIQNKVGAYLTDPRIRSTLIEYQEELSFRRILDEGKMLVVNLSRGVLGGDTAHLLGSLLVSTLTLAALSRADTPKEERTLSLLYLDEFEHLVTGSIAELLSEVRKMNVGVTLAHQYLHQLPDDVREAVLGNVGTIISFRVGPNDARILSREFEPVFSQMDLLHLGNYEMYVKLMIQGEPSGVFSARGRYRN